MPIIKQADWEQWEDANKDAYGKCCVDVAREVMRRLDTDEYRNLDVHTIISDSEKAIDSSGGITGFMAGCIAQMVSKCHSRGEEFRIAWNKYYGIEEDKAKGGIVNPAILTIGE